MHWIPEDWSTDAPATSSMSTEPMLRRVRFMVTQLVVVREAVVVAVVGESEALDDEVGRLEERVQNRGDGVLRASAVVVDPADETPRHDRAQLARLVDQRAVVVPQAAARPQ